MIAPIVRLQLQLLALGAAMLLTAAAAGGVDAEAFRRDLRQLCQTPTRVVGSDGYDRAGAYIVSEIAKLPNVELRRHAFPVMVPVTRSAVLDYPGGDTGGTPVYPFWPAHVRVNATPTEGITGRCVYMGRASYEEIRPAELKGQIAVCESAAGQQWVNAFYFGAKALIVLGGEETNHAELRSHELTAPVNLPRFYLPRGKLADELRAGRVIAPVKLTAAVDWQRTMAVNFYALVRGATSSGPALTISVPYDSSGLVPDVAMGASQAAQAACGLALLRDISKAPLNRPVLIAFTGADSIAHTATRQMFMALSDVPALWRPQISDVRTSIGSAHRDRERLRDAAIDPTRLHVSNDRAVIDRIAKTIETDAAMEQDELFRLRRDRTMQPAPAQVQREQQLEARQTLLNRLRYTFIQRPAELRDELAAPALEYVQRTSDRLDLLLQQHRARLAQLENRVELYQWLAQRLGRNIDPGTRANDNRLIELLIALDLSDAGTRVGPMFIGNLQRFTNISQIQDYRDWFARQERAFADGKAQGRWWGEVKNVIDMSPFGGSRSAATWLTAPMAIGSELCQAWGVPGFSLITLDDLRLGRDTPDDTLDRLDIDAILPQLAGVQQLLRRAWNDPAFRGPVDLRWQRTQLTGQVVSPAPGRPVPDLPREDFLITYHHTLNNIPLIPQPKALPWTLGVRRHEVHDTDAEGNWLIEGLPRLGEQQMIALQATRVEQGSGDITACSDLGKQRGDIKPYADLKTDVQPLRNIVFSCEEFSLVGLYDPRFLQSLTEVTPLDARRNAEPQRYNMIVADRMMAGFVEPGARTSLLFRFGRVGNRLILINMPDASASAPLPVLRERSGEGSAQQAQDDERSTTALNPHPNPLPEYRERGNAGRGLTVEELRELDPLAVATARDFHRLDQQRLTEYRRAGVSSSLIDAMQHHAGEQLAAAERAAVTQPAAAVMTHATGSWANNARVYSATQDMANDVVRAAIFLLLLCVPFAFCMERLLIGTPNVYRQIAGAIIIFAVMTLALWSFHPAFRISSSPLIIVLAFAIIFMSIVVMFVVYSKFDTELKRIRSGRGTAEALVFARASVLSSAVLLGIANMRKRKFRTGLTSVTIVLITFAVLCFTSATRYLDTTTLPTGDASTYSGVMLRQRGFRPLPETLLANLRPLVAGHTLVERWWNANPADPREMINIASSAGVFGATAVVGLSPGEAKLSRIAEIIGPEKFARLERGEKDVIYLSRSVAEELKIREDDIVRVGGTGLKLAGTFDASAFDDNVRMLSGEPLTPLKFESALMDAGGRSLADVAAESLDLDANAAGGELGAAYEHLSSNQIAIVPAAVSKLLPNASLRSVAIDLGGGGDESVKRVSDELAKRFAVALFAGYSDGVRMVAASNLASVSGAGQVAIPLAIAGLIIFNTMLGSIAERRREIHVYTSLGLAPLHVGALFVAEAMTYGLIGTVFGYVIGQGAGTALLKLGWLGPVTLNYSGTAAIVTMSLILLIVLASSIVPARIAARVAAPSIERTWKVPEPVDGWIVAELPFTINRTAADGALAYLLEFFEAHREGSIGRFSADRVEVFETDEQARGIRAHVWLTPFDLGVRQGLELLIHPGAHEEIYEVRVALERLSGDDASWYRMNRTFLTELRKQFLQWRSLSPAKMLEYVEESRKLFAQRGTGLG